MTSEPEAITPQQETRAYAEAVATKLKSRVRQLRDQLQDVTEALRAATDVYGGQTSAQADQAYRKYIELSAEHSWWALIESRFFGDSYQEVQGDTRWLVIGHAVDREARKFLLNGENENPGTPDELDRFRARQEITAAKKFREEVGKIIDSTFREDD